MGLKMANYDKYSNSHGEQANIKSSGRDSGLAEYVKNHKDMNIGWEVISEIKKVSGLPVVAKGVMCAEDALRALENGADAIFVSNHGARQLDTTYSTIEVLEEVVKAVRKTPNGDKVEIYFDGGVRRGSDIFKAIALGANAVFLGRAVLWGLATDGQKGVERILHILNEEFKETMLMTGCRTIEDIRQKGQKLLYQDNEIYTAKL